MYHFLSQILGCDLYKKATYTRINTVILQPKNTKKLKRFAMILLFLGGFVAPPFADINLMQTLHKYSKIDPIVASNALKKLKLHLWCLTEEMVPLSLFDYHVEDSKKRKIADTQLKVEESADTFPKNRKGNRKPIFPQCVDENSSLEDLTGEDTWYFFTLLKIETDFLKKPVEEWSEDPQFITKIITVVNDCSERGINLATDFHSSANAQNNFENTLQLVEKSRSSRPNLQKRSHTKLIKQFAVGF